MEMTGDLPLGLYETPEPQVRYIRAAIVACVVDCLAPLIRALSPEMLAWCAGSGRFLFHKDTSVDTEVMLRKLAAVQSLPHRNLK